MKNGENGSVNWNKKVKKTPKNGFTSCVYLGKCTKFGICKYLCEPTKAALGCSARDYNTSDICISIGH